jgi:hypothetical protein
MHLPRRPHERLAGKILLVAGLFADQHHSGSLRAFAEHGLRRVLPEMTGAAAAGFIAQGFEAAAGRAGCSCCHGVFRLPLRMSLPRTRLNAGRALKVPSISLLLLMKIINTNPD